MIHAKVELLDKNENLIDVITGEAIGGTVEVNKENDIRRTFSLELANIDGKFTWEVGGRIWIDKRIKLYVGEETSSGIDYKPQGVFLLKDCQATSSPDGRSIARLAGEDKWRLLSGEPIGKMANYLSIAAGTKISAALKILADSAGIGSKVIFDDCATPLPYKLEYQPGDPYGKVMKELAELAVWSLYFDVNGYLRFRPHRNPVTESPSAIYDATDPRTDYAGGERSLDDSELYNKVIVVGGSSRTPVATATAVNSDPANPVSTVNIGERIFFYNNGSPDPLITTQALAQARADYELKNRTKIYERQAIQLAPRFDHEAEDVIQIIDPNNGTNDKYEVLQFSLSLRPEGLMSMNAWKVRDLS